MLHCLSCTINTDSCDRFPAHCQRIGEGQHYRQEPVNGHHLIVSPQRQNIEKTVADAEQFAAIHVCGEVNYLLSKFSTNKRY